MKDLLIMAELHNGKKIVLEPNLESLKCKYRYLTEKEIDINSIDTLGDYIWLDTPIYTTVEDGEKFTFNVIEGTPVVLSRMSV